MSEDAKADGWMPFYIGDYLADTMHLSTEQHGAYLLIMFSYWRKGSPVDDDTDLSEITGLSLRSWKAVRPKIQRFFQVIDGRWRHKRIDAEMTRWAKRKSDAIERAKKAANGRWKRTSDDASSIPQAMHEECPTSTSTVEKDHKGSFSHSGRDAPLSLADERAKRTPEEKEKVVELLAALPGKRRRL